MWHSNEYKSSSESQPAALMQLSRPYRVACLAGMSYWPALLVWFPGLPCWFALRACFIGLPYWPA